MSEGGRASVAKRLGVAVTGLAGSRGVLWAGVLLALADAASVVGSALESRLGTWIDLWPLPASWQPTALLVLVNFAIIYLVVDPAGASMRRAAAWVFGMIGVVAALKALVYYVAVVRGSIRCGFPVPFALLVGFLAWAQARAALRKALRERSLWRSALGESLGVGVALCALALAHILLFGMTATAAPAQALVVFGARVYADGTPSLALYDRVLTACDLYKRGLAPVIVLSGGGGHGAVSEPQAMERLAMRQGVPHSAIIRDEWGVNTRATVANVRAIARDRGWRRVIAVSHYYHLSRIDLSFHRYGLEAGVAPARQTRRLALEPYYVAREVAAWLYYFWRFLVFPPPGTSAVAGHQGMTERGKMTLPDCPCWSVFVGVTARRSRRLTCPAFGCKLQVYHIFRKRLRENCRGAAIPSSWTRIDKSSGAGAAGTLFHRGGELWPS